MATSPTAARDMLHLELPTAAPAFEALEVARQAILRPSGLDEDRIAKVLGSVMGYSVDYADLYFALSREESWSLEDGIVQEGTHSIEQGVGVRALAGELPFVAEHRVPRTIGSSNGPANGVGRVLALLPRGHGR